MTLFGRPDSPRNIAAADVSASEWHPVRVFVAAAVIVGVVVALFPTVVDDEETDAAAFIGGGLLGSGVPAEAAGCVVAALARSNRLDAVAAVVANVQTELDPGALTETEMGAVLALLEAMETCGTPVATNPALRAEVVGYGDSATLDALWDDCAVGDRTDCDLLASASLPGSAYWVHGVTCGNRRSTAPAVGLCAASDDIDRAALRAGCEIGDLVACDKLRLYSQPTSPMYQLAARCGGPTGSVPPGFGYVCIWRLIDAELGLVPG